MDSDRFLEPATSASSTASDSDQRPPRRRSTFEEDDSDSSHAEDARHDHRADLQRMMSRRTFAVADVGLRHRARSSMTGSAGAGAADVDGQHGRRASTVVASEANEVPPEDQPNANQVVDFFRTVNKDAHKLKRLGSDGVQGCGGLVVRLFASCLRRVGLGNPGASVENMAFGTVDPLDFSTKDSSALGGHGGLGRGGSTRVAPMQSGEYMMEEELEEEEEDDADEEELSAQKKKVSDLGELPALDWSNASAKLLVTTIVTGILLFTLYSGWMDRRVQMGRFSLRQWLNGLCVAIGAYFIIELMAKAVAGFFKWTRLLHTNNKVWIFIKLHKEVSLLIWSTSIFLLWKAIESLEWAPQDDGAVGKILGCFLAYTATNVVSEMCKVEMAHRYMWRPYLERARASIWSQYVIFMMTDYAMGLQTKDAEGQALALGFSKTKKGGEHLSLYTVGKAIGFVHANALKHPLGAGRPGTDKNGMIDSKTGARLFGGLLFDTLMEVFNKEETNKLPAFGAAVSDPSQDDKNPSTESKPASAGAGPDLPRPFGLNQDLAPSATVGNCPKESPPPHRKLSSVLEAPEEREQLEREDQKESGDGNGNGGDDDDGSCSTSTDGAERWQPSRGLAGTTSSSPDSSASAGREQSGDDRKGGGGRGEEVVKEHRRSGGRRGSGTGAAGGEDGRGGRGAGGHRGIQLAHLRKMTSKAVALKIMELFEVPPEGVVTRKEFVDRVIDIFVQRRSLQLTLGDYEAILTKVGFLLSVVSAVVVFFVALRIFGYNIGNLVLTWLSLAVAFSFLFGSSASAFFESIIFVFVTKAYDVGDPVFFVDDTGSEDWYVVTRINILTTVFRRWDGQATLIANNLMAKKAIRNQWRSSPYLHHTMIAVSSDTPMEKLDQMKAGIAAGMRRGRHRHRHGLGGLMPDTVDYSVKGLTDGNRLSIFVSCRQRENSANMGRRFGNSSFFHKLLVRECNRHGINYTLPTQPLLALGGGGRGGEEAIHAREDFLGSKPDRVDARR